MYVIYNMALRCVIAISALYLLIAALGYLRFWSDIADTYPETMLHIIYSIPNMYGSMLICKQLISNSFQFTT